ncbi:putative thymidylate synthase [Burkholderia phage FLC6]|nr:putative thymidylate synthase [Burkholderia phage FLC6]
MKQYLDVLKDILETGDVKTDRTGTGTTSKFGGMMKFSLRHGIWPIPTTREVAYKKIAEELEWMLKGIISVDWLQDRDNKIWNSWMGPESGTIGPMYGEQWRNWTTGLDEGDVNAIFDKIANDYGTLDLNLPEIREYFLKETAKKMTPFESGGRGGVDQLMNIVNELKNNPDSRRLVVNVWHAGLLPDTKMTPAQNADAGRMALAPCHSMWQVNTAPMSAFEVLRYSMDQEDFAVAIFKEVFEGMRGLNHEAQEQYYKTRINSELVNRGLLVGKSMQYNLGNDGELELTEAGQLEVDKILDGGFTARKLSLACFARSQDVPLGTVFNVGMYSLLAHLLAEVTGFVPWEYTHFMGDYHIYHDQHEGVNKQLERTPMAPARIIVDPTLEDVTKFDSTRLTVYYKSHPPIRFKPAAV